MADGRIDIAARDGTGSFAAYASGPETAEKGIVVIQEVFGVNATMRTVADHWGEAGYRAIVPDLFWRIAPGTDLDSTKEADRERAMELYRAFYLDDGIADCHSAITRLREGGRRVGVVGYCLGGRLAYHMATRSHAAACVGYYGVGIENVLAEAGEEMRPLLLHFGEADEHCGAEARARIYEALGGRPQVELHTYEGAGHAFARPNSVNYEAEAAALADERTAAFIARHLD